MYTTNHIRIDGKRVPVKEALELMTDEWLQKQKEKYSWVTVKNLRDIVEEHQILVEYLQKENKRIKKDFEEKLIVEKKFNEEWRKYTPDNFDWGNSE
jgi:hypothetical protein